MDMAAGGTLAASPASAEADSDPAESHEAIVVGAGSAGLAAAVALGERSFETLVIECADAVGARWRSRYDELRLNSWRPMSKLQGRGMPRRYGRYPHRDDVIEYLEGFAADHRVPIRFKTRLLTVEPNEESWRLQTSTGPMHCRYLVIATGWDAVPVLPMWPGRATFVAELIHSSDFRGAHLYRGRDVLVVGAGNSGFDIASHLVKARARVTLSMRTPPNLVSREVFGIPGQPLLVYVCDHVPHQVADLAFSMVQKLTFGDLGKFGIPRAPLGPYATYLKRRGSPAVDDGFIDSLKRGSARVVGEVDRLDGADVVLLNGMRLRPDAVICATGYRRGLEALVGHLGVLDAEGAPTHHGGAPEHPRASRLYFCGMWNPFSGQIRLGPLHARRIARAAAKDRASMSRALHLS